MLSDEQIISFQKLYRKRFNREVSREEAYEQGIKLIRLVGAVYKPMTAKEREAVEERRKEMKNLKNDG